MLRVNGNAEEKKTSSLWCRKFEAIARHKPEKYEHNEWINSYSLIPDIKVCAPLYPKHSVHGQWQSALNCIFIKIHIKWTKSETKTKRKERKSSSLKWFESHFIWCVFFTKFAFIIIEWRKTMDPSLVSHGKMGTQCEQITLSFSILFFGLVITYYMHTYK